MKTITVSILFLAIVIAFFPTTAKGQGIIPGKWKLDGDSVQEVMGAGDLEKLGMLPEAKRMEMLEELASRTFTFFADGGFVADWVFRGQNRQLTGGWREVGGKLFIESETETKTYTIEVSDGDLLVLVPEKGMGILQKLSFTKSN